MAAMTDEQELAALREAYQQLLGGKMRVSVGSGDKSMSYAKADLAQIRARIDELERRLGVTKPVRPFRVTM